jgi:hypothetical protein
MPLFGDVHGYCCASSLGSLDTQRHLPHDGDRTSHACARRPGGIPPRLSCDAGVLHGGVTDSPGRWGPGEIVL